MNPQQLARYKKSKTEIRLIDFKYDTNYIFRVNGSKGDVYKITIDRSNKTLTCSCPDAQTHAKRNKYLCKHCCYVLCKLLGFYYKSTTRELYCKIDSNTTIVSKFMNTLKFTDLEMSYVENKIKQEYKDMIPNNIMSCIFKSCFSIFLL